MEAWLLSDPDGERLGPLRLKSADLPRQRRQFCVSGTPSTPSRGRENVRHVWA